jgi:hypothetical protein
MSNTNNTLLYKAIMMGALMTNSGIAAEGNHKEKEGGLNAIDVEQASRLINDELDEREKQNELRRQALKQVHYIDLEKKPSDKSDKDPIEKVFGVLKNARKYSGNEKIQLKLKVLNASPNQYNEILKFISRGYDDYLDQGASDIICYIDEYYKDAEEYKSKNALGDEGKDKSGGKWKLGDNPWKKTSYSFPAEATCDTPDHKHGDTPEHKPGHVEGDKPGHKPGHGEGDKPGHKPGHGEGDKPGHKPGDGKGDKPGHKPGHKPGDTPIEKPGDTPTEKPGDTPTEKPGDTPTEKPGDTPTEKPGDTPTEKPGDTPTEKPGDTPTEKPGDTPTEKPGDTPTEKPGDTPTEKPDEGKENEGENVKPKLLKKKPAADAEGLKGRDMRNIDALIQNLGIRGMPAFGPNSLNFKGIFDDVKPTEVVHWSSSVVRGEKKDPDTLHYETNNLSTNHTKHPLVNVFCRKGLSQEQGR